MDYKNISSKNKFNQNVSSKSKNVSINQSISKISLKSISSINSIQNNKFKSKFNCSHNVFIIINLSKCISCPISFDSVLVDCHCSVTVFHSNIEFAHGLNRKWSDKQIFMFVI